jgi:hypothetical protein
VRAKSLAVRGAEQTGRKGEKNLLPEDVFQLQTVSLIITDFGLGSGDCAVIVMGPGGVGVGAQRAVNEVEVTLERLGNGGEAAGTLEFEVGGIVGADADVVDDVMGAIVFFDEVGAALDGERRGLANFFAEVDGSGCKGEVENYGLLLEGGNGDAHGVSCSILRQNHTANSSEEVARLRGDVCAKALASLRI